MGRDRGSAWNLAPGRVGAVLLTDQIRRIREFVEGQGVRLPMPFDGLHADVELLAPLDKRISTADCVMLGELNHFVHEKGDFRLFLTRYLVSRGILCFAEEMGWSDGVRVNRFFETGDEGQLDRLPSFGYVKHQRADRDDRPSGILRAAFDAYPVEAFRVEQKRFYRGLRANLLERLRYFGFDIDGSPGGTYEDLGDLLEPYDGSLLNSFLRSLARLPGESLLQESSRLRRVAAMVHEIHGVVGQERVHHIRTGLSALIASLEYVAGTNAARSYEALRPGMALREDAMKRRVHDIELLSCGLPVALMGHALHLTKDDRQISASGEGVGPGGGLTSSLGHWLSCARGRRVISIWFLYGAGSDSQPFPNLPRQARYPGDSLNAVLGELECPLFFQTDSELFDEPVKVGHMYNAVVEVRLRSVADAIFFLPRVTPLQGTERNNEGSLRV